MVRAGRDCLRCRLSQCRRSHSCWSRLRSPARDVRYTSAGLNMRRCLIWEIRMAVELSKIDTDKAVEILSNILELELAGVVRYLHYSFMIFGHNRIPIVAWLRSQADESQRHAVMAGEHITSLGGHPSLKIGKLLETHKHNVDEILREALVHEQEGLAEYHKLLILVEG